MKIFPILLAVTFVTQFSSIEAHNQQEPTHHCPDWVDCGKSYIKSDQVHITNQEIFVRIEEGMIRVQGIYVDNIGCYFNSIHRDDAVWFMWKCSCGKRNEGYLKYCKNCSRQKPENS